MSCAARSDCGFQSFQGSACEKGVRVGKRQRSGISRCALVWGLTVNLVAKRDVSLRTVANPLPLIPAP